MDKGVEIRVDELKMGAGLGFVAVHREVMLAPGTAFCNQRQQMLQSSKHK